MKRLTLLLLTTLPVYGGYPKLPEVGPNYQPPSTDVASHYKGATSSSQALAGSEWWQLFGDPTLNALMRKVDLDSKNLRAAAYKVEQVRAQIGIARSDLLPKLNLNAGALWTRYSNNAGIMYPVNQVNDFTNGFDASYEIDLWGRVRRGIEAVQADYQAGSASYDALRLSLRAEVARLYFSIRALDSEQEALARTVAKRRETLGMMSSMLKAGAGNDLDVERAQTEMAIAQTDFTGITQKRVELENALAVLTGQNPSKFRLDIAKTDQIVPPIVPAGLPSELLKRRPDILQAERQLAAANSRIGVVQASSFPTVKLSATAGVDSSKFGKVYDKESRVGSFGITISFPLLEQGKRKAALDQAHAAFQETAEMYKQSVLAAFQDVENALSNVRVLARQQEELNVALNSARKAAELSHTRYRNGLVGYLEVIEAERTVLQIERSEAQLRGARFIATTALIKALGGGWQSSLPPVKAKGKPSYRGK